MANTFTLLSSSTDETGDTFVLPLSRQQAVCQISITGTQTVTLQGRINSSHDWVTINSTSTTDLFFFTIPGQVRAVTSGTSTGSSVTTIAY